MSEAMREAEQSGYIDCYAADFPADDPQSAASFAKVLLPAFDFEVPASAASQAFTARTEIYCLPDITVSRDRTTAGKFTRTIEAIAARGTDQFLVICYTSGHFNVTVAGETKRVEAGEIVFIDLSQQVVIEAPMVENLSLAVSRRKLEAMVPFLNDAHGFVREQDALAKLLRGMLEDVVANGPTMPIVDARGVTGALLQLVAACLEPLSRKSVETGPGRSAVSLVAIKAFIEQRLLEPTLGPQTLLDAFGVTRSTLYRMFEPLGGVSAYIMQRKLSYAFRLLSDTLQPRRRISKLSTELGFSHPSAFTRAFKDTFGLSPKDVQALAEHSKEQDVQLLTSPEPLQYFKPIASATSPSGR
jgi:AraC-like DNA-binding protein